MNVLITIVAVLALLLFVPIGLLGHGWHRVKVIFNKNKKEISSKLGRKVHLRDNIKIIEWNGKKASRLLFTNHLSILFIWVWIAINLIILSSLNLTESHKIQPLAPESYTALLYMAGGIASWTFGYFRIFAGSISIPIPFIGLEIDL